MQFVMFPSETRVLMQTGRERKGDVLQSLRREIQSEAWELMQAATDIFFECPVNAVAKGSI